MPFEPEIRRTRPKSLSGASSYVRQYVRKHQVASHLFDGRTGHRYDQAYLGAHDLVTDPQALGIFGLFYAIYHLTAEL